MSSSNHLQHDPPNSNNNIVITKYSSYPKPQAEFQEIIQNPDVFLQKLQSFHLFYGTKFRIPTLAGNPLDLHRLFIEVTSRGGIEKVVSERRWKEVTGAFNFPSTITSASFVLRRFYMSLLYHFEQVYYFRKEEEHVSAAANGIANGATLPHSVDDGAESKQLTVSSNLEDGSVVTGTIDGKFDYGYVVTVKLGTEEYKGVLYHASEESKSSQILNPKASQILNPPSVESGRRARRKHQMAFKDPTHPKRNRSGYTFFFAEQYHRLRPSYHGQERAISQKIGQLWSRLTDAERQVYKEKGLRDKERYTAEMLEYKSSHHMEA